MIIVKHKKNNLSFRYRIKLALVKLPLGLYFISPMRRMGMLFIRCFKPIMRIMRRRVARIEARIINSAIHDGVNHAVIVYDNLASGPTYGDFLHVVLLARYFIARGIHVSFYIVDSGLRRKDWSVLSEGEGSTFVEEQLVIAKMLLDATFAKVQRVSWRYCQSEVLNRIEDSVFPFFESVQNRIPIYLQCFNLLNLLLSDMEMKLRDRVLFSYKELSSKIDFKSIESPYITWHCRYSLKWEPERNTKDDDFLMFHAELRSRFPRHSILVVSDTLGCAYFAKLARKHNLQCLFSKDYSQSFMGDGALVLGSTYFFVMHGGGMSSIPIFSSISYGIILPPLNYIERWSRKKVMSWQTERQSFYFKRSFTPEVLPIFEDCNR